MEEFRGLRAAGQSIAQVVVEFGVLLRITLLWSLILAACLVIYALAAWKGPVPFDIAGGLDFLSEPENFRLANGLTSIPNTLASLSVAILWTRFVVRGTKPTGWIAVPAGSGRYFGRSLLIVFGAILGMVPGLVAAAVLASQTTEELAAFGPAVIVGLNAIVVLYICLRLWLVFPAIALGDSTIGFKESFRLTRPFAWRMLGATLAVYAVFLGVAIVVGIAHSFGPLHGVVADVLAVGDDVVTNLLVFAAAAASVGVTARAYQSVVPDSDALPIVPI